MAKLSSRRTALLSFVALALLVISTQATPNSGDAVQTVLGDGKVQCRFPNGETKTYVKDCDDDDTVKAKRAKGLLERRAQSQPAESYANDVQPSAASAESPAASPDTKHTSSYGSEAGDNADSGYAPKSDQPSSDEQQPGRRPSLPDATIGQSSPQPNSKSPPPCCEELGKGAGGWKLAPPPSFSPPPVESPVDDSPKGTSGYENVKPDMSIPGPPSPGLSTSTPAGSTPPLPDQLQQTPQPERSDDADDSRGGSETTTSSRPVDSTPPSGSGPGDDSDIGSITDQTSSAPEDCDENKDQPKPEDFTPPPPPPAETESSPTGDSPDKDTKSTRKHAHHKHKHHEHKDSAPPTWAVDVPQYRTTPPATPNVGSSTPASGGYNAPVSKGKESSSTKNDQSAPTDECSSGDASCGDVPSQPTLAEGADSTMCGPAVPYTDLVHLFVPASNESSSSAAAPAITSGGASIPVPGPGSNAGSSSPATPVGISSGGGSVPDSIGPVVSGPASAPAGISSGGASVPPPSGGVSASGLPPAPVDDNSTTDSGAIPREATKTRIGVTSGGPGVASSSPSDLTPVITSNSGSNSTDDCNACPKNSVSTFEFKTCEFVALVHRMQLSAAQLSVFDSGLKAMLDNSLASYNVDSSGNGTIASHADSPHTSVKGSYLDGAINESISQAMGNLTPTPSLAKDEPASPPAQARNVPAGNAVAPEPTSSLHRRAGPRFLKVMRRHY